METNIETLFAVVDLEIVFDAADKRFHDLEVASVMTELCDEYFPAVKFVEV